MYTTSWKKERKKRQPRRKIVTWHLTSSQYAGRNEGEKLLANPKNHQRGEGSATIPNSKKKNVYDSCLNGFGDEKHDRPPLTELLPQHFFIVVICRFFKQVKKLFSFWIADGYFDIWIPSKKAPKLNLLTRCSLLCHTTRRTGARPTDAG